MPDPQLIGLILLLAVAVVFGYFYFKKAQLRDHPVTPKKVDYPSASVAPRSDAAMGEVPRRDAADEG